MNAQEENEKYTKQCPYNEEIVSCVQYPDDDPCDCDPCNECEWRNGKSLFDCNLEDTR